MISGYLITSIIHREISNKAFSISGFYERRARRILPALLFVVAVTLPFSWVLLPNEELGKYFESVAGVAVFVSNFVFLQQDNYFDAGAEIKPLLHTWTLAVEEQFYIVFPLLMLAIYRGAQRYALPLIAATTFFSFLLSVVLTPRYPDSSFFLLHTRFWELGVGSVLALLNEKKDLRLPSQLSWVGLILIALGFAFISQETIFPGYYAAIPVLGAALVIATSTEDSLAVRFLSWLPLRWLGLLSYSIYLWHWPILVFGARFFVNGPNMFQLLAMVGISVFLGYLSWRFVEAPFRKSVFLTRQVILVLSLSSLVFTFCLSYLAAAYSIGENRITRSGLSAKYLDDFRSPNRGLGRCDDFSRGYDALCVSGDSPDFILWGDSYAMHLAQALSTGSNPISFVQLTHSACGPFIGLAYFGGRNGTEWGAECIDFNDKAFEFILQSGAENVVISTTFVLLEPNSKATTRSGEVVDTGNRGRDQIAATITDLVAMGKNVLLVSPMPRPDFDLADCIVRASFQGNIGESCDFHIETDRRRNTYSRIDDLADQTGAKVLFLKDLTCQHEICRAEVQGYPLYRDNSHLSVRGSELLGEEVDFPNVVRSILLK